MTRGSLVIGLSLVVGLGACGEGAKQVHFPVDSKKVLSTLSSSEIQAMCEAMAEPAKDALDVVCLSKGITAKFKTGGTEQSCQAAIDSCRTEMQTAKTTCGLSQAGVLAGCTATVGEYEACLNDSLVMANELQSKISCSSSMSDLQELSTQMNSLPASCTAFQAKCPKAAGQ